MSFWPFKIAYQLHVCLLIIILYSDISEEVKAALRSMEKAEELGLEVEGDRVQVGSLWKLHDSSLKEILNVLGGWRARSPSEFAAEFFQMGM